MTNSDEQFFEQLAGAKSAADENYAVELAKANAVASRTHKPKMVETETERSWDENEPAGELTVDVYQTPDEIVVESAIAGVRPEDIDIQATPDSISIKGSRRREREVNEEHYLCRECYWGKFARTVLFPQEVNPDEAAVNFKNGILTVRLPKVNKRKTKQLKVRLD